MINTIITREGEAVPVRLLPIASKPTVTAERWTRILSQCDPDMSLTAYHFVDGLMMELPPKYWRDRASADQLPPGAFVWRDQLETAYSRVFYSDALRDDAPDGPEYVQLVKVGEDSQGEPRYILDLDNDLLLDAPLSAEERQWVFEGLGPLQEYAAARVASTSMPTEREIWEIHFNDSSPVRWDVIAAPKGRLMPRTKAVLWMHGLNPDRHPHLRESINDDDVPKIIPRRVRDAMGAEDFFRHVRDALEWASSEKIEEATAAEWLAWANEKEIPVHSKFYAIGKSDVTAKPSTAVQAKGEQGLGESTGIAPAKWWQKDHGDLLEWANRLAIRMRDSGQVIARGKGRGTVSAAAVYREITAEINALEQRRAARHNDRPRPLSVSSVKTHLQERDFDPNR